MNPLLTAGIALALSLPAAAQEKRAGTWYDDFDAGAAAAREQGKDLIVDFTGSDWCGWCKRLRAEVWEHDSFAEGLSSDMIFVSLDFPRGEEALARVPNPERNDELQKKYQISGFPTILLMTPDGEVFGQTGYQPGGPEAYVKHVKELSTGGKATLAKIAELEQKFESAEDKPAVIRSAIAMIPELSTGRSRVAKVLRSAFELDPTNESGLKLEALHGLFDLGEAGPTELAIATEMDGKNEIGLLEKVQLFRMSRVNSAEAAADFVDSLKRFLALDKIHDNAAVQMMCVNGAAWCARAIDRPEDAKVLATRATELGEMDGQMQAMIGEILQTS